MLSSMLRPRASADACARAGHAPGRGFAPALAVGAIALSGCAAHAGRPQAPVRAQVIQPPTLEISTPDAVVAAAGLRFHGCACRDAGAGGAPRAVRIERLDDAGRVTDAVYGRLAVSGAESADVLEKALNEASKMKPAVFQEGDSCGPEGC